MSGKNAPIQIPSELNVPDDDDDNNTTSAVPDITSALSNDASNTKPTFPKHHLMHSSKSRSMYNIVTVSNDTSTDQSDDIHPHDGDNKNKPPEITLSPPSAKYRKYGELKSTVSLDRAIEDRLMGDRIDVALPNSTNELKAKEDRIRANSLPRSERSYRDSGEFDELKPNQSNGGSQLRIRSSIISLFGRMGRARRSSNLSQNSSSGNGNDHAPPLRALPQIAATKILRAFSYVGKGIFFSLVMVGNGITLMRYESNISYTFEQTTV